MSVAKVERLLGKVLAKGEVTGYTSFESGEDVSFWFLPDKLESSYPDFIGHLSDYLGRATEIPGPRFIWIMERDSIED